MRWFKLTVAALAVLSIVCFTVQNSSRTTDLSLDLWVGAWKLADPAPIPMLMWGCFAGGAVLMWAAGARRNMALSRRVRQLEQEMALAGRSVGGAGGGSAGTGAAREEAPKDGGWA